MFGIICEHEMCFFVEMYVFLNFIILGRGLCPPQNPTHMVAWVVIGVRLLKIPPQGLVAFLITSLLQIYQGIFH